MNTWECLINEKHLQTYASHNVNRNSFILISAFSPKVLVEGYPRVFFYLYIVKVTRIGRVVRGVVALGSLKKEKQTKSGTL